MFYELLEKMADLHSRKNHDYSSHDDPLKNLRSPNRLGVTPFVGVLVRLQDKWSRLEQFATSGELLVKSESVEDTLLDNAVYSLLAIVLYREQVEKSGNRELEAVVRVAPAFPSCLKKAINISSMATIEAGSPIVRSETTERPNTDGEVVGGGSGQNARTWSQGLACTDCADTDCTRRGDLTESHLRCFKPKKEV